MYLAYVDESGTPPLKDTRAPNYILSCLVVCEQDWHTINDGVEAIKVKHFGKGSNLEIHSREIYRRKNQFSRLQPKQNLSILGDVYSLLASSNLTLISVVIDKQKFYNKHANDDAQFWAWKLLLERIHICIGRYNKQTGIDEYGLIIMDESVRAKDEEIRKHMLYLRRHGTGYQNISRIIEDPIFSPSHWRNLIQLADALAYCCAGYERKIPFFQQQFLTIQNKFDKDSWGNVQNYGYKKYP